MTPEQELAVRTMLAVLDGKDETLVENIRAREAQFREAFSEYAQQPNALSNKR